MLFKIYIWKLLPVSPCMEGMKSIDPSLEGAKTLIWMIPLCSDNTKQNHHIAVF